MTKKALENYLAKRGMKPKQRIDKNGGGQYLDNFLIEFAMDIKEETLNEAVTVLKKMRF